MTDIIWILPAAVAVVLKVAFYTAQKSLLNGEHTSLEMSYISVVYGLLATAPIALWQISVSGIILSIELLGILVFIGIVESLGLFLYLKALETTDLSVASPIKKMKTVFIPFLEVLLLGALIKPILFVAAILAGIGGALVLLEEGYESLLNNIRSHGVKLAFVAMFIYSLLSISSRFGTTETTPFIFGFVIFLVTSLGYRLMFRYYSDQTPPSLKGHFKKKYFAIGSIGAGRSIAVWIAYSIAAATAVSTFTQLTVLFTVITGGTILDEDNLRRKVVGTLFVIMGSIVVILFG